jgi:hypothetical protein
MEHLVTLSLQITATLVGIVAGTLIALRLDRWKERRRKRQRATTVLGALQQELATNHQTLLDARTAFRKTPWGCSFHVSTFAFDTAASGADLSEVLGHQLAGVLTEHYGWLHRLRYSLDLLTRLWMVPHEIEGYESMRAGFHQAVAQAMHEAISRHDRVQGRIRDAVGRAVPAPTRARSRGLRGARREPVAPPTPGRHQLDPA